jgi:hypothetical protein
LIYPIKYSDQRPAIASTSDKQFTKVCGYLENALKRKDAKLVVLFGRLTSELIGCVPGVDR